MKSIQTIRILVLLAVLAALAGCTKEALPGAADDTRSPITITVSDDGYAASDKSVALTRATENGYVTEFTAGDQIGLYVVKGGEIVATNICLTAAANGNGGVSWTGNAYYEGVGAKYFAYYPYQSTVSGTLTSTASTAADFFADVVSKWTPAADQGTHAKYTAQDLMIGNGTLGGKEANGNYSLSLSMTHAMALVVIETPMIKYTFTNTPAIPDYYVPAPNTKFYGFTPYSPLVGTYRLLVNPAQSRAANLVGSYTGANGNTKEYTLSPNNLTAANYAYYRVDGGITSKSHTLQVGDFYMKDGELVGKDATLTSEQRAACIGIVFCVEGPLLSERGDGFTRGLVVASQGLGRKSWYDALEQARNYTPAAPAGISSGWYLPNLSELSFARWGATSSGTERRDFLNGQFVKVSGAAFERPKNTNAAHWTSTEVNDIHAYYVPFDDNSHNAGCGKTDPSPCVRSILAF